MESIDSPTCRTLPAWSTGRRLLDLVPATLVALTGALTITLYAAQGPRSGHIYWLTLALAENVTALGLLRRHPAGALAGVLATFLLFDNPATMALPVAVALLAVAAVASRRSAGLAATATAVVVVAAPILHRDSSAPALSRPFGGLTNRITWL
jgi:hypothetical protein